MSTFTWNWPRPDDVVTMFQVLRQGLPILSSFLVPGIMSSLLSGQGQSRSRVRLSDNRGPLLRSVIMASFTSR